jgi:aquaporin Z
MVDRDDTRRPLTLMTAELDSFRHHENVFLNRTGCHFFTRGVAFMLKKLLAEFIGTFWLTFGGCGSAVLAAMFVAQHGATPINLGIGLVGVSLAFGLTVMTMAYAIGHISGCHLNPAVSVGLFVGGRFHVSNLVPYIIAQTAGAIAGAIVLWLIATGKDGFSIDATKAGAFATNGYGDYSPGGYSMLACLITEVVLTFFFLIIILGSTDKRAPGGFAPIPIGLGLTLIHLIGIPVTNLSVNPARSVGPAVITMGTPLMQLWLFIAAPIAGAILAGIVYRIIGQEDDPNTVY